MRFICFESVCFSGRQFCSMFAVALFVTLLFCPLFVFAGADETASNAVPLPAQSTNQAAERKPAMKTYQGGEWSPDLTTIERKTLVSIARATLEWCTREQGKPFAMEVYEITPALRVETATFVTLKIDGNLRGCIGSLAPEEPLYLSVHHNTINAAMRDPRFRPVSEGELKRISIDVSILSPIRPIRSLAEFKTGRHGVIMSKDGRRAVFLPEVALEQGWSMEETLDHLSLKAGLPAHAWKQGAGFQVFESFVLSE